MMFEYRVTKYDPANRNGCGAYAREEWTSISDIGRSFDGTVFTEASYRRVEDAYATAAIAFLREAGIVKVRVDRLEIRKASVLPFSDGAMLGLADTDRVVRGLLREEFWCRLESTRAFIHVGYDYYMYVGVPVACPEAKALSERMGLFVEPFRSPYRE